MFIENIEIFRFVRQCQKSNERFPKMINMCDTSENTEEA